MKTKIYIDEQEIDLEEAEVDTSFSISDINNLTARKSGKTIIIKAPATDRNKKIFENYESNVIGKKNEIIRGKIKSCGLEIEGNVYIYESENIDGYINYRFQIIFDNANWINDVGDDSLADIDLSDFDHVYNITNIVNSWILTDESLYSYPLCDYGDTTLDIDLKYMRPAYRIAEIVKRIFNEKGYNLESTFFNSDFFRSLWLLNPTDFKKERSQDDYLYRAYGVTKNAKTTSPDAVDYFSSKYIHLEFPYTNFYNGFNNGYYDESDYFFKPDTTITVKPHINLLLKCNTTGTYSSYLRYGTPPNNSALNLLAFTAGEIRRVEFIGKEITFNSGDNVGVWISMIAGDTWDFDVLAFSFTADSYYINSDPQAVVNLEGYNAFTNVYNSATSISSQYSDGNTIYASETLKGIKQIDLIKSLKHLFNLYFLCNDVERVVYCEPFDTFYTGASRDFSAKLDESEDIRLSFLDNNKKNKFTYKKDSNDLNQKELDYRDLGGYENTQLNVNAKDKKEYENELFSSTIMKENTRLNIGTIDIPIIVTSEESNAGHGLIECEPRILYFDGETETIVDEASHPPQIDSTTITDVPKFYFKDDLNLNSNSLSFHDFGNNKGLYQRYYDGIFKIYDGIYDTKRIPQLLECSLILTESDISNIINTVRNKDLRACIYLDKPEIRGHYYIQEIQDYNPDKVSCKCTLIRVLDRDSGFNLIVKDSKIISIPYNYGMLYNWYAIDSGKLAPTGYRVPTLTDIDTLITYDTTTDTFGKYKSTRTTPTDIHPYWNSNVGSENKFGLNFLAGGTRTGLNTFTDIGVYIFLWINDEVSGTEATYKLLGYSGAKVYENTIDKFNGFSVRCMRDATVGEQALDDGTFIESIIDASGNYYNGIKIGTQVWLNQNLKTTKYNDGTSISQDTGDWTLVTDGLCASYNNQPLSKYQDVNFNFIIQ